VREAEGREEGKRRAIPESGNKTRFAPRQQTQKERCCDIRTSGQKEEAEVKNGSATEQKKGGGKRESGGEGTVFTRERTLTTAMPGHRIQEKIFRTTSTTNTNSQRSIKREPELLHNLWYGAEEKTWKGEEKRQEILSDTGGFKLTSSKKTQG